MGSRARITFSDGTAVYLEVDESPAAGGAPGGPGAPGPRLPAGMGGTEAVGIGAKLIDKSGEALTAAVKPLMSVLETVHDAVSTSARRPDELSVQLGFKLDSALDLVVVRGHGESNFTVTAKWNLAKSPDGGSEVADADEES